MSSLFNSVRPGMKWLKIQIITELISQLLVRGNSPFGFDFLREKVVQARLAPHERSNAHVYTTLVCAENGDALPSPIEMRAFDRTFCDRK